VSIEDFMVHPATLQKPTGEFIQTLSGEATPVYEEFETLMAFQPRADRMRTSEGTEVGYVSIGDWMGWGYADVDFGSWSRIVWEDRVFDIVGPPRPMENHRTGVISHNELDLQLVGDPDDQS